MKKITISKLFLYKYRFVIGYILLGLAFVGLLFSLPLFSATDLSSAEMSSAVTSYNLRFSSIFDGALVDLPYHLLQKCSILLFGLNSFSIKLPSIIIGLLLGFLLILLLNRWFKNNVSLLASALIVLSTPFLFLAGSGTPLIMLVFWPTLLLWLGSKIQGEKRPKPSYCLLFAIALLLAIFTPYMLYFAVFCVCFVIFQPHLRFIVKSLPKFPLIVIILLVLAGLAALTLNIINKPETILALLFAPNFELSQFFPNIAAGFSPVFSWNNTPESVFLSPLIGLPAFALALIGLFSTTKGFFASRNSIASLLLVFTIIITGFNPDAVIFFIIPLAILVAHGLKYLLEKWYSLFPENPYARISGLIPLVILFALILIPSLLQYFYGYRYNPNVANEFIGDLSLIREHLTDEELLVPADTYDFYRILEDSTDLTVVTSTDNLTASTFASLGVPDSRPSEYRLSRIITSPKSDNSDRIYLYQKGE